MQSTATIARAPAGAFGGTGAPGVCVWRGIRYAQPPIGPLRFRAPQPVVPASGMVDASTFGAMAPQFVPTFRLRRPEQARIAEDCLFLNIWSPAADERRRPVIFWIHGGAFMNGSGSLPLYDGSHLARRGDVVVVTINYRVGPLGFLYLGAQSDDFESNLGLKDQIAALRWVRENIAAFGGDPDRVTIAGESAGATCIVTLLAMPSARGLFHRAIAQSAADAVLDTTAATRTARRLAAHIGFSYADAGKLREVTAERLTEAGSAIVAEMAREHPGKLAFAPVMAGDSLPHWPLDALRDGAAAGVPLLIGTNQDEATVFARDREPILPTTVPLIRRMIAQTFPQAEARLESAYRHFASRAGRLAYARDAIFLEPSLRVADAQAQHAPVWMYRFDWSSRVSRLARLGAAHGLELCFVFGTLDAGLGRLPFLLTPRHEMVTLAERMQDWWLSFTHAGDPGSAWESYVLESRATLAVNNTCEMVADPHHEVRAVWDEVRDAAALA